MAFHQNISSLRQSILSRHYHFSHFRSVFDSKIFAILMSRHAAIRDEFNRPGHARNIDNLKERLFAPFLEKMKQFVTLTPERLTSSVPYSYLRSLQSLNILEADDHIYKDDIIWLPDGQFLHTARVSKDWDGKPSIEKEELFLTSTISILNTTLAHAEEAARVTETQLAFAMLKGYDAETNTIEESWLMHIDTMKTMQAERNEKWHAEFLKLFEARHLSKALREQPLNMDSLTYKNNVPIYDYKQKLTFPKFKHLLRRWSHTFVLSLTGEKKISQRDAAIKLLSVVSKSKQEHSIIQGQVEMLVELLSRFGKPVPFRTENLTQLIFDAIGIGVTSHATILTAPFYRSAKAATTQMIKRGKIDKSLASLVTETLATEQVLSEFTKAKLNVSAKAIAGMLQAANVSPHAFENALTFAYGNKNGILSAIRMFDTPSSFQDINKQRRLNQNRFTLPKHQSNEFQRLTIATGSAPPDKIASAFSKLEAAIDKGETLDVINNSTRYLIFGIAAQWGTDSEILSRYIGLTADPFDYVVPAEIAGLPDSLSAGKISADIITQLLAQDALTQIIRYLEIGTCLSGADPTLPESLSARLKEANLASFALIQLDLFRADTPDFEGMIVPTPDNLPQFLDAIAQGDPVLVDKRLYALAKFTEQQGIDVVDLLTHCPITLTAKIMQLIAN